MTGDDFRDIALDMQGAVEGAHMGHPDFRANGRIFASLHANERVGTVKLASPEQREFMRLHPAVFSPASGAWGRQGWTMVELGPATAAIVRGAVILAWQGVTTKREKAKGQREKRKTEKPKTRKR
jgi:hypothetical protein